MYSDGYTPVLLTAGGMHGNIWQTLILETDTSQVIWKMNTQNMIIQISYVLALLSKRMFGCIFCTSDHWHSLYYIYIKRACRICWNHFLKKERKKSQ